MTSDELSNTEPTSAELSNAELSTTSARGHELQLISAARTSALATLFRCARERALGNDTATLAREEAQAIAALSAIRARPLNIMLVLERNWPDGHYPFSTEEFAAALCEAFSS